MKAEEIEVLPDDDILNNSDLNQNISAEIESIDGDNDLHLKKQRLKKKLLFLKKNVKKAERC